jgi:hypothetical protein
MKVNLSLNVYRYIMLSNPFNIYGKIIEVYIDISNLSLTQHTLIYNIYSAKHTRHCTNSDVKHTSFRQ